MSDSTMATEIMDALVTGGVTRSVLRWGSAAGIPANGKFLSIAETGGTAPNYIQNEAAPALLRPSLQFRARADDYDAAKTLILQAYTVVSRVRNQVLGATYYHWIRPIQQPFDMGVDENNRPQLAFNVNILKRA